MATVSDLDGAAARAAVLSQAARVTTLLRAGGDPGRPALGDWDVADLAAHVSHSLDGFTAAVRGAGAVLDDVWDLSTLSGVLVAGESTRTLAGLADRIEASVAAFTTTIDAADEGAFLPWLVKGLDVPLTLLVCEALNELVVHGRDLAHACGAPWPIERAHAVLVLEGFLFPSLDALGRTMVDQQAAAGLRACFEVHLRGGGSTFVCFDEGDLAIGRERPETVDCHLWVDPVAFLLVSWGRVSQWPAIGRGQLLAWGRRPWLGLKLRALLRNP